MLEPCLDRAQPGRAANQFNQQRDGAASGTAPAATIASPKRSRHDIG
jgi:hypothetical protein